MLPRLRHLKALRPRAVVRSWPIRTIREVVVSRDTSRRPSLRPSTSLHGASRLVKTKHGHFPHPHGRNYTTVVENPDAFRDEDLPSLFEAYEPSALQNGWLVLFTTTKLLPSIDRNIVQITETIFGQRSFTDNQFAKILLVCVDGISDPAGVRQAPNASISSSLGFPPNRQEGISWIVVPRIDIIEQTESDAEASRLGAEPQIPTKFILTGNVDHAADSNESQSVESGEIGIQIALANTLFVNGRLSTLKRYHLQPTPERDSWKMVSSDYVQEATVVLMGSIDHARPTATRSMVLQSNVPMMSLTTPRKVNAASGNILRQLVGKDNRSIPASHELENAVTAYFDDNHLEPQLIGVWALIKPHSESGVAAAIHRNVPEMLSDTAKSPSVQGHLKTKPTRNLWQDIMQGSRLVKVISGGGGWGDKAGLLSLDPDQPIARPASENHDSSVDDEMYSHMPSFLTSSGIVREHDFVSFHTPEPAHQALANPMQGCQILLGAPLDAVNLQDRYDRAGVLANRLSGGLGTSAHTCNLVVEKGAVITVSGRDSNCIARIDMPGSQIAIGFRGVAGSLVGSKRHAKSPKYEPRQYKASAGVLSHQASKRTKRRGKRGSYIFRSLSKSSTIESGPGHGSINLSSPLTDVPIVVSGPHNVSQSAERPSQASSKEPHSSDMSTAPVVKPTRRSKKRKARSREAVRADASRVRYVRLRSKTLPHTQPAPKFHFTYVGRNGSAATTTPEQCWEVSTTQAIGRSKSVPDWVVLPTRRVRGADTELKAMTDSVMELLKGGKS